MTVVTGCVRNTAPAGTWTLTLQNQDTEIVLKAVADSELRKIMQAVVNDLGPKHAIYDPMTQWFAAYPAKPPANP